MDADALIKKIRSFNVVKIQTDHPEKILNLLQLEDVPVLEVRYTQGYLFFKIVNSQMPRVNAIAGKLGAHAECVKILGAEKAARTFRKRAVFIGIACFFLIAVFLFTQCIWHIDIYAARILSESEIREFLYENGIKQSLPKRKIDCDAVETLLLKEYASLSDVQVELNGTKLVITVTERESPIVMFDKSIPVDLVASESGTVGEITVYNGTPCVNAGDYVNAGDVLIGGAVSYTFNDKPGVSYVHAMGKILMYKNIEVCDIIINKYIPLHADEYASEKIYYLFGKTVSVGSIKDKTGYMFIEEVNKPVMLAWIQLPLLYDEIKWYDIKSCREKTQEEIAAELYDAVQAQIGDKCTLVSVTYTLAEDEYGRLRAMCIAHCACNMAIEKEITQ
jgi:sporulation protein YqfD